MTDQGAETVRSVQLAPTTGVSSAVMPGLPRVIVRVVRVTAVALRVTVVTVLEPLARPSVTVTHVTVTSKTVICITVIGVTGSSGRGAAVQRRAPGEVLRILSPLLEPLCKPPVSHRGGG
eukprot:CAMPEP_0179986114 /NCGR_PEP_ID=MMETSP0984-20121128/2051_1 /TAXON_ID=483367 /ORGANISM="non described non described, Strain CCMP 2436" /LENGTH=119 /DNA_ID=CAMNT_0021904861 /DNA_START=74 /DNA_END=430 /DNA_ORIENTATION=+